MAREWAKEPPIADSDVEKLLEALVADDNIPLIQSTNTAAKCFDRIIREVQIESNRGEGEGEELQNLSDLCDGISSKEQKIEYIAPLVGLSFDAPVQLANNLEIRRLTNFEKELILNARDLGGGSVGIRQTTRAGNLTHAAIYNGSAIPEEEWKGGLSLITTFSREAQEALNNLRISLRLFPRANEFRMDTWHALDKTFYPVIINSHESARAGTQHSFTDPISVSNPEELVEYYELVSAVGEDEGLRVAIDRLESSHKKISNADCVVDAIIGVEALLSTGAGGSFREVRRRAAVLSGKKSTYSELGRLQNLRNRTVHGQTTQVDRNDLNQAQTLLSTIVRRIMELMIKRDLSREQIISELDAAIEGVIESQFDDLLSEIESN